MGINVDIAFLKNVDALNEHYPRVGSTLYLGECIKAQDYYELESCLNSLKNDGDKYFGVIYNDYLFTWYHGIWQNGTLIKCFPRYSTIRSMTNERLLSLVDSKSELPDEDIQEMLSVVEALMLKMNSENENKDYEEAIERRFDALFKILRSFSS